MKTKLTSLLFGILALAFSTAGAAVRYVNIANPDPAPPYTEWATAATNIQDAIDAAEAGDEIVVTNGMYADGVFSSASGGLTRVVVDRPITVRSVNGPSVTIIVGYQEPENTNGPSAVRCAYLASGATLSGFTLTNGATLEDGGGQGGGVYCESAEAVVSNCILVGNSAQVGGGAFGGTLNECALIRNRALEFGGGAAGMIVDTFGYPVYRCTLKNCTLTENSAASGGGASLSALENCSIVGNSAGNGGGAAASDLRNCTLTGNQALFVGGGAASANFGYAGTRRSSLINCILQGNSASSEGGGAYGCTLNGSTLSDNSAQYGGGASGNTFSGFPCTLNDCTLTGNSAQERGGGAFSSTLENCTLIGNSALYGGGVAGGDEVLGNPPRFPVLKNCLLTRNSAWLGGGSYEALLENCTIARNRAGIGGGSYCGSLKNCILYHNEAALDGRGSNFADASECGILISNCCTTPMPLYGQGNITNEPVFINLASGNFRLQSNSPCINAGHSAFASASADLDGNPRIAGGTVDMGAYEFQNPTSLLSYAWLQRFGLPIDGSADDLDPDGDHLNNFQEWRAGTDPTNASSVLRLLIPTVSGPVVVLTWESVSGKSYFVERSSELTPDAGFTLLARDIAGGTGTTTYTDSNVASGGPYFYRVRVE